MTRRILLTLGASITDTHCGDCPQFLEIAHECRAFGDIDDDCGPARSDLCLAVEAAAARMVEIEPEDLARCKWSVAGIEADESAERIVWALSEHARKVSR